MGAPVDMDAAVLECLSAKVLELVANAGRDSKKSKIIPGQLQLVCSKWRGIEHFSCRRDYRSGRGRPQHTSCVFNAKDWEKATLSVYHSRSQQQQRSLCIELFFESCNGFHVAVLCSVIDHRWLQNVVGTKKWHMRHEASVSLMFLPHFDAFCDLLLVSITQLVD